MPDGGYPLHLILRPKGHPDLVVHSRGGEFRVFTRDEWDEHVQNLYPQTPEEERGTPLLVLNDEEAKVLAAHLGHWLPDAGHHYFSPSVDADYE